MDRAPNLVEVAADPIWGELRRSAQELAALEPFLRRQLEQLVLSQATPAAILAALLARRLACASLAEPELYALIGEVLAAHPEVVDEAAADLRAVTERDPACPGLLHVLLNLKGFAAIQIYRVAHRLWQQGRQALAFALSNQAAIVLCVDIHPAARIGRGVMFDHADGIVVGETAVIEDEVSILQGVTLGGTGKEHGDRHPKIRHGVMIGAGAKILGNIEIGEMSKVAAGSVVLKPVPAHCTVAGVPARVVRRHRDSSCPALEMDQAI